MGAETSTRVYISAGEASGDAYGASLTQELKRLSLKPLTFEGIGGRRMREAGVELYADSGTWGAISISQSLRIYPRVVRGYYRAKREFATGPKGVFIPIDFGFANLRLARHAKNNGWKVLYFVPPGSWRRDRQGADLPAVTDAISTPFEWSAEILRKMGANAHWFGHPIKQLLRESARPVTTSDAIAVLPGSRVHELAENLPLIAQVLSAPEFHGRKAVFGLAPNSDLAEFKARWQELTPTRKGDEFIQGATHQVLRSGRAAIVCSGTATLEAALCRCPMVVVYRVSRTMEIEAKILRFKRPKFIALPNILLDRTVVPELVQDEGTPETVSEKLREALTDGPERQAQLAAFDELDKLLGGDNAITRTAELALTLLPS